MLDLNSKIFYKVKFAIKDNENNPDCDLLWKIICHIKNWQIAKWDKHGVSITKKTSDWSSLKFGTPITSSDGKIVSIQAKNYLCDNGLYWACKIIESHSTEFGVALRKWITEIGYQPTENNTGIFSCVIYYSDRAGYIGKCQDAPSLNVPKLIKRLLEDRSISCYNGVDKISIKSKSIKSGQWKDLWEKLLDGNRTIPYIYISPKNVTAEGDNPLLVNPEKIATAVGGNALVFYTKDHGVQEEMQYFTPSEFACYNGSIRIYYPTIRLKDFNDSYRHRFLSESKIIEFGEMGVYEILHRALAQDVSNYDDFFRVEDCQELIDKSVRKKRLEELHEKHKREISQVELETMSLAEDEELKRLEVEEERDELKIQLDTIKAEKFALESENESFRVFAKENAELRKACDSRLNTKTYPKTAKEIVNYFDTTFGDRIKFSEDAEKSLKSCRIPQADLWDALYALATSMWDLYFNGSGDIFKEFKRLTGLKATRGEGHMTRADSSLMKQFQTDYNGEVIDIEPHITYSSIEQSIHFGFSNRDKKVIIGSCGEHKDVYSTRKKH